MTKEVREILEIVVKMLWDLEGARCEGISDDFPVPHELRQRIEKVLKATADPLAVYVVIPEESIHGCMNSLVARQKLIEIFKEAKKNKDF